MPLGSSVFLDRHDVLEKYPAFIKVLYDTRLDTAAHLSPHGLLVLIMLAFHFLSLPLKAYIAYVVVLFSTIVWGCGKNPKVMITNTYCIITDSYFAVFYYDVPSLRLS